MNLERNFPNRRENFTNESNQRRFFLHSLANSNIDTEDLNGTPATENNDEHLDENAHIPRNLSSPTFYIVPVEEVIFQTPNPMENMVTIDTQPEIPIQVHTNMFNNSDIHRAISTRLSFLDQPLLKKYSKITPARILNVCFVFIVVFIVALAISTSISARKLSKVNMGINANATPTQVPSLSPTLVPLVWEWSNETMIHIDVEREDLNELMGYSVSISEDGNKLAVGGRETLHIYHYIDQSWIKAIDFTDLISSTNTMENLSRGTIVRLTSDGSHLVVGDYLASRIDELSGAGVVMVFCKTSDEDESQWRQLGSTIYGHHIKSRLGSHVEIADNGERIAVSNFGLGYAAVYDYNGSDWTEKRIKHGSETHSGGSIAISSNGEIFAFQDFGFAVVKIYNLITFNQVQILSGSGLNTFGHSMSFSRDASVLAISDWEDNQVYLYHYNLQKQRYAAFSSSISVPNVSGLGHSVSVSGDGRSLAVGVVSPPSKKIMEVGEWFEEFNAVWVDRISERGSVFMFKIEHEEWEEVARFEHNSTLYEKIGWTVSLSGNGKVVSFGSYGTGGVHGDGPVKSGQVGIYRSE